MFDLLLVSHVRSVDRHASSRSQVVERTTRPLAASRKSGKCVGTGYCIDWSCEGSRSDAPRLQLRHVGRRHLYGRHSIGRHRVQ